MTVFAGIAEFERDLIRERTYAGRESCETAWRIVLAGLENSIQSRPGWQASFLQAGKPFGKSRERSRSTKPLSTGWRRNRKSRRTLRSVDPSTRFSVRFPNTLSKRCARAEDIFTYNPGAATDRSLLTKSGIDDASSFPSICCITVSLSK